MKCQDAGWQACLFPSVTLKTPISAFSSSLFSPLLHLFFGFDPQDFYALEDRTGPSPSLIFLWQARSDCLVNRCTYFARLGKSIRSHPRSPFLPSHLNSLPLLFLSSQHLKGSTPLSSANNLLRDPILLDSFFYLTYSRFISESW